MRFDVEDDCIIRVDHELRSVDGRMIDHEMDVERVAQLVAQCIDDGRSER